MSWSRPSDLKTQLSRLWERGELLREAVTPASRFPLRLALKGPTSRDITERFEAVRAWTTELASTRSLRLEWRPIRHRIHGEQKLPAAVWVDDIQQALIWLGKQREWQRFAALAETTASDQPALLPWLTRYPLKALAHADDWPRLLEVVGWMARHPRPDTHVRQVDLPGIHSKFIEAHRGILTELFDLVLPADAIASEHRGVASFAARYGFRQKPVMIRLRSLDPDLRLLPGTQCPDLALDADSFASLATAPRRVIITENETNYLALPRLAASLALFGGGYGWQALSRARWLATCVIHYWGDIDTHGFVILDRLRGHFPHVASLLMDRATLDAHRTFWGHEDQPERRDLERLDSQELALYDALRDNRIQPNLRLEQEHLGFDWVRKHLDRLLQEV